MILRLTKKVQDNFKLKNLQPIPETDLSIEWYANVFTAGRLKYFLVTHGETLFSVVFRGAGIRSDVDFYDRIILEWKRQLEGESLASVLRHLLTPTNNDMVVAPTLNRRVLGSMKDMIQMTQFILEDEPSEASSSPFELSKFLNKTPYSFLGMDVPKNRIEKYK